MHFLSIFALLFCTGAMAAGTNPDNSLTFNRPVLLRGTVKFKVTKESTVGICALFRAGYPLPGSAEIATDSKKTDHAVLNEQGKVIGFRSTADSIGKITCYDPDNFAPILISASVTKNPDGSFLISAPAMEVGGATLPLSGDPHDVCAGYGMSHFLTRSATLRPAARSVVLDSSGRFLTIANGQTYESLSCFQEGEHRDTGSSDE
jgi:hypothetical protein